MKTKLKPSSKIITTLEDAHDLLNAKLFDNSLSKVIFNLNYDKKSVGYFHPNRWRVKGDAKTRIHEINFTPFHLNRDNKKTVSTLAHEMCHQWQQEHGQKKSTNGYHNKEWAEKMLSIGLKPVSIDNAGHMTGQKVTHEIITGKPFDKLIKENSFQFTFYVHDTPKEKEKKERKNKIKYTCAECGNNVWGKPELLLMCIDCEIVFEEQPQEENQSF